MSKIIIIPRAFMSFLKYVVLYLTICDALLEVGALVELPQVEENDIAKAENVTRIIMNKLFATLRLKDARKREKLKDYSLIHNYFVSLTLQDYSSLKEIARLSRVDKTNISNETANYIALLNEILNEDRDTARKEAVYNTDDYSDDYTNQVEDIFKTLADLKEWNDDDSPHNVKDVLTIVNVRAKEFNVSTNSSADNNTLTPDDGYWTPSKADSPSSGRRIYEGRNAKIRRFPFMAVVLIFQQFQCGGSIIDSDMVLTSASCLQLAWNNRLFRENPVFISVRVGSSFHNAGGEEISVFEVYFHPLYNPKDLRHNLAMMKLIRHINFESSTKVRKIRLDKSEQQMALNVEVLALGWGARSRRNIVQDPWRFRLGVTLLDVYPLLDCKEVYSNDFVHSENFCAGAISKGSGACNHDVGGPGVVDGVLTGVMSYGPPVCGATGAPTVFTKIGFYTEWIEELLEKNNQTIKGNKNKKKNKNNEDAKLVKTTRLSKPTISLTTTKPKIRFTVKPIGVGLITFNIAANTQRTLVTSNLRNANNTQTDQYKAFLKTLFSSEELEKHIDLTHNDSDTISKNIKAIQQRQKEYLSTTKSLHIERITKLDTTTTTTRKTTTTPTTIGPYREVPINNLLSDDKKQKFGKNTLFSILFDAKLPRESDRQSKIHSKLKNNQTSVPSNKDVGKEVAKDLMTLIDQKDLTEIIDYVLAENENEGKEIEPVSGKSVQPRTELPYVFDDDDDKDDGVEDTPDSGPDTDDYLEDDYNYGLSFEGDLDFDGDEDVDTGYPVTRSGQKSIVTGNNPIQDEASSFSEEDELIPKGLNIFNAPNMDLKQLLPKTDNKTATKKKEVNFALKLPTQLEFGIEAYHSLTTTTRPIARKQLLRLDVPHMSEEVTTSRKGVDEGLDQRQRILQILNEEDVGI